MATADRKVDAHADDGEPAGAGQRRHTLRRSTEPLTGRASKQPIGAIGQRREDLEQDRQDEELQRHVPALTIDELGERCAGEHDDFRVCHADRKTLAQDSSQRFRRGSIGRCLGSIVAVAKRLNPEEDEVAGADKLHDVVAWF